MAFNINSIYFSEHQYIAVFVKGIVDSSKAKDVMNYAFAEMQKYQCNKVYFDVSETLSLATTSDNFELANNIPELIKTFDFKWVVYYKNDPFMYEYISDVIKTLGVDCIRIMNNKNIAKDWLLKGVI